MPRVSHKSQSNLYSQKYLGICLIIYLWVEYLVIIVHWHSYKLPEHRVNLAENYILNTDLISILIAHNTDKKSLALTGSTIVKKEILTWCFTLKNMNNVFFESLVFSQKCINVLHPKNVHQKMTHTFCRRNSFLCLPVENFCCSQNVFVFQRTSQIILEVCARINFLSAPYWQTHWLK